MSGFFLCLAKAYVMLGAHAKITGKDTFKMSEKSKQEYLVLARKYRPQNFEGLVGQEALVQTLKNAIDANRVHHAFVLSGVRGIGKTTTARILAKALNCENGPAVTWAEDDKECQAIADGRHVDVLEFDAASHTGVDDIRELFEGVNYQPVQGRYKVYIIDEVHMLSRAAFNALLKTLEEPPAHVKFIFATTEVHKIPVTVLSRCQRFDLKRLTVEDLTKHFESILSQEDIAFEPEALPVLAKAADGSARDGMSLLDQAISRSIGGKITLDKVNDMLGLADKARIYDLIENMLSGNSEETLGIFQNLYQGGYDPLLVLSDMLATLHLITRLKVVPKLTESQELSQLERERGGAMAKSIKLESLSRAYQMLLTAMDEAKKSGRLAEAVEMALVRVLYMAPVSAVELLAQGKGMVQAMEKMTQTAAPTEPSSSVQDALPMGDNPPPWDDADAPPKH